jgi:hypothetical protein
MAASNGLAAVERIQGLGPLLESFIVQRNRVNGCIGLSAAADTTARTAHDLDKVIAIRIISYGIQQFAGVAQTMSNRYADFFAVHFQLPFFDALESTNIFDLNVQQGLAGI